MAGDAALQLLDSDRAASAQVFSNIQGAMSSVLTTEKATADMTVDVATKQFQIGETRRTNDAQLASLAFRNNLAAAQHNAEMDLMPLKLEAEKLRIQASSAQIQRETLQDKVANFGSISAPFDTEVASQFALNKNPQFANAYLEYRGATMAAVASGTDLDPGKYAADVNALKQQYAGQAPVDNAGYSPEVATLLDKLSPQEAARYRAKNPANSANIIGLKASAMLGRKEEFNSILQNQGHLFNPEETTQLVQGKQAYDSYDQQLKPLSEELNKLTTNLSLIPQTQTKARAELSDQIDQVAARLNDTRKKRDQIYDDVIGGKGISVPESDPSQDQINLYNKRKADMAKEVEQANNSPVGIDAPAPFEGGKEVQDKQSVFGILKKDFPDLDGVVISKAWGNIDIKNNPVGVGILQNTIRNTVRQNLDSHDDDKIYAKLQPSNLEKIFEKLKGKTYTIPNGIREGDIPKSGKFGSTIRATAADSNGALGNLQVGNDHGFRAGLQSAFGGYPEFSSFRSAEDVKYALEHFDGTPTQKRLYAEDIYSALMTGVAMTQLTAP